MEIKRVASLIVFVLLLIAGFLFYFIIYLKQPPIQGYTINNGRDGHGCLVRSGFEWDNSTQNCQKKYSDNTIIYQIIDFKTCLDAGYGLSEDNKTNQLQCQSSNGTIFIDKTIHANTTKENLTIFPDNIKLVGNFTIENTTNNS